MIKKIIAAIMAVSVGASAVPLSMSDEQKLIDENRMSISFHAERLNGATKVTRIVVIPDVSLKDCNGTDCSFGWGHESVVINDPQITTTTVLDLKAMECNGDKATGMGTCVQRVKPLTDLEYQAVKAIQ
jgi:hypothetical protein